ncbi:MAG TPA: methyltransferase domain-containing protein [Alphaproteobacteria bacterium]|nr:methyltransferase domain-containing protein [Alphaproteobacteria bacterium]
MTTPSPAASTPTHQTLVTSQFGPRAAAYVASAVHAQGEDLKQLAAMVAGHSAARLLDLGCGGGHVAFNTAPHVAEVVAYDLSSEMLEAVAHAARQRGLRNIVTRQGAVESLPFPDASFDFVVTRFSAHHWRDFPAALREARRVLKPGGRAAFADTVTPGTPLLDTYLQSIELLRDPSHVRNYTEAEWIEALRRAGFAPGAIARRRLRLEFTSWVERMRTPELHVQAIRSLQARMSAEVHRHFCTEPDGSYLLDVMLVEAAPA